MTSGRFTTAAFNALIGFKKCILFNLFLDVRGGEFFFLIYLCLFDEVEKSLVRVFIHNETGCAEFREEVKLLSAGL